MEVSMQEKYIVHLDMIDAFHLEIHQMMGVKWADL